MMIGHFIIDTTPFEYLEPLWPVLEDYPDGISLADAVKQSGLEEQTMLNHIEQMSNEYKKCSRKLMSKGVLQNLLQSAFSGEKTDKILAQDMATSWIFDKVMLYDRIHELHWTDQVTDFGVLDDIKQRWMEFKGV